MSTADFAVITRAQARSAEALELRGYALMAQGRFAASVAAFAKMFAAKPEYQAEKARTHAQNVSPLDRALFWKAPHGLFRESRDAASVFTRIYDRGVWGGGSGAGSNIEHTVLYAGLVQYLLASKAVRSVVDLGCGDWRFSRYIDFHGVDYLGVDIVPSVVTSNNAHYGAPGIRFELADVASFALPECDLVLCKDVFQHLDNSSVSKVCAQLTRARLWLITNDFHPSNEDCENGDTRPLDPTVPPFRLDARPVLAFGRKVAFLAQGRAG